MKVLVTHPGRQHSHQAALALEEAGMLAGYWAGVPAVELHRRWIPDRLWRRFVRYAPVPLPAQRVRWAPWVPALRRLGDRALPSRLAAWTDFLACRLFDRWAAARLRPRTAAGAVVACEISALATFRKARRLGMVTILDAAATHHRTQDRLHGFAEPAALHRRITAVKDAEIALADHVLTVSELARQSYLEAGVPPERVHCVSLGVDVDLFAPGEEQVEAQDGEGTTFVFVGAASRIKGLDLLLEAFARVRGAKPVARLLLIGPPGDASSLLGPPVPAGVTVLGPLSQADLARRLRAADCLVLPSRNESFGMVVPEALAAGLPVLVSDRAGAAALIQEGRNGWVVPAGDAGALARRMLHAAGSREELCRMREACRRSAAACDWSAYGERLSFLLRSLLEGQPPP
ncbi:MAG TPA: glycosyltransferase family 4 protein [Thermoanaerobaculia bacterium]|jgi:glycosyltransferase involved in cell wall biosynthesis|nr:glycosyltransferase family 4 protein [Thermoanaerobaculia bacterium]